MTIRWGETSPLKINIAPTRQAEISDEARKFIESSSGASWETVDLTSNGVKILRDENSEVAAPGCNRLQRELGTTTEDGHVGQVSVQWVTPQQITGSDIVLYIFGGGFICGRPEDDLSMTATLADMMGRRVCVPRYRLAPEHPYPAAKEDIFEVYNHLCRMSSVIVIGQSAGGNLALGLVLQVVAEGLFALPVAIGLISPWIDLTHSGESHAMLDQDPTLSVEHFLRPAALAYAGGLSPSLPCISPLFTDFVPAGFPPTTISTATRDLLASDSINLAHKLQEKHVTVDLQITRGLWHVYEWYPQLPEAAESLRHISNFLLRHLLEQSSAEQNATQDVM